MHICTEHTGERYRGEPVWQVELSNGLTVYQNDSDECPSSWLSLKAHVETENLYLKNLILRFRDHTEVVADDREGYFFIKSVTGHITGWNQHFYVAGFLHDDLLYGYRWIIPELIRDEPIKRHRSEGLGNEVIIRGRKWNGNIGT